MALEFRGEERMAITNKACEELQAVSEEAKSYWTPKNVRQWWQNHKKLFVEIPKPTPKILPPDPVPNPQPPFPPQVSPSPLPMLHPQPKVDPQPQPVRTPSVSVHIDTGSGAIGGGFLVEQPGPEIAPVTEIGVEPESENLRDVGLSRITSLAFREWAGLSGSLSRNASTVEPSTESKLVMPPAIPPMPVVQEPVVKVKVESREVDEEWEEEENTRENEVVEEEVQEEESQEEEYDPIPKVPERTDRTECTGELDSLKHEYFEKMREFYRYMRTDWKQKRPSLETQAATEERFIKLVRQFKEIVGVVQFSFDKTMPMAAGESSKLKRVVSDTTRMYATGEPYGESGKENMTETAPTVFVNNNYMAGRNRLLSALGQGKLVGDGRTCERCPGTVGCAARAPDGLAYAIFDKENSTKLVYGDKSVNTGFFSRGATSMIFDERYEYIFVAGDVRVKCFKADTLECIDTFCCRRSETQGQSCLAIVDDTLVLADGDKVFFWSLANLGEEEYQGTDAFRNKFRDAIRPAGVNPQFVDWTPGKKPDNIKIKHEFSHITGMCVVGDILAIASEEHEAVHLFQRDADSRAFSLCGRLIGHSAGITCMMATKDGKLVTGSHDKLVRVWDLGTLLAEVQFCGHESSVISGASVTVGNAPVIITGGKDSTIYFWDLQAKKNVMKICVSPLDDDGGDKKARATCIAFDPTTNRLGFIAETCLDIDSQRQTRWDCCSSPKCELQIYQFVKP